MILGHRRVEQAAICAEILQIRDSKNHHFTPARICAQGGQLPRGGIVASTE
jgi:hypothetical protein